MENSQKMHRRLGLLDATMIVAGSMIGSGIFIVSADIARTVGSSGWLLMAWVVAGLVTLTAALSYGELAGMMPEAGGQFVYIRRAFGKLTAFLYGWTVFTVIQTGVIAAVGVAFAKFAAVLIPQVGMSDQNIVFSVGSFSVKAGQLVSLGVIALLTAVNIFGVKNGSRLQVIFTSAKLLALLALIVLGISAGINGGMLSQNFSDAWTASKTVQNNAGQWITAPLSGFALVLALGSAMIGSLFSSDAWNNVTFIAGEIKDPSRNIPRSLFLGTLIVTVLYVLANVAYLSLLPVKGVPDATAGVLEQGIQFASYDTDRVGTSAATFIFGDTAIVVMAVLIMISTFGCNNGLILAGARLFYAMAKDGLFFKQAGRLNRYEVPATALVLQGVWAGLLCFTGTYGTLIEYATFASLIFYCITIAGIFVLRRREPDAPRPYKALGYPFIPALYIVVALFICGCLLVERTQSCVASLIIVAVGLPVYYLFRAFSKPAGN